MEGQEKVAHQITKEEQKQLASYENGKSYYRPNFRKYDYRPNGRIRIDILDGSYFRDTDQILVEERLDEILIALYIHYHVRSEGQIVKKAVYIAIGIDLEGRKDVLGMWVGENESAKYWATVLSGLKNRGVNDIFIACTDNLTGFSNAINAVFPQTDVQNCIIHDLSIATAAEQLLHYNAEQIKGLAKDVLEGNMREIIGQMTISELIQNRDKFAQESIKAAMSDMQNMGLEIINLTIQNFSDNEGKVIDTMAIQNVVIKEQEAAIAKAKAEQESNKAQIAAQAAIAEQNKQLQLLQAQYKIEADQEKAKADQAYAIEQERVRKEFEEQRAAAELTRLERATELKRQEVEIERERLNVEVREKAAAEKDALIFKAEAERVERQAQADAQLYEAQKEAEAIRLRGEAEAEAIRKKAEAMQLYGQAAMLEMVVDKLPDIARSVSEPLSKTEKIILFGEGGATSMARDPAGTMLQTFEAVKQAVGLDIPRMLKDVTTGGLVGKAAAEESETPAEAAPSSDDSQVQE